MAIAPRRDGGVVREPLSRNRRRAADTLWGDHDPGQTQKQSILAPELLGEQIRGQIAKSFRINKLAVGLRSMRAARGPIVASLRCLAINALLIDNRVDRG